MSQLRNNTHNNKHLQKAFDKYGEENFEFEILEYVEDKGKLIEREQYWLDTTACYDINKGYNLSPTAGSTLGFKMTEETKNKISKSRKGKCTEKDNPWFGKTLHKETKLKMSKTRKENYSGEKHPWFGEKHTLESKEKMSESSKGEKNGMFGYKYTEEQLKEKSENVKGSKNPMVKLTEEDVVIIRQLLVEGLKQKEIAKMFNITQTTVSDINRRKRWKHII